MKPSLPMSNVHRPICRRAERSFHWLPALMVLLAGLQPVLAEEKLGHSLSPVTPPVEAPGIRLKDMDGAEVALENFRGKVLLLNFWATWCPPCRREMPSMEKVYQALGNEGFSVVAINQYEDPDHVFAYIGQLATDPSFPILFDPDSSVSEAYRVKGLPSTFLIDKHGRIRYQAIGGREYDHPEVISTIRALLAED